MPKSKFHIVRRIRGTTLTFDPMGKPKFIHTNRGPREMEQLRKRRAASLIKTLRNSSLQERDTLRDLNQQSGMAWEARNEDDDGWNDIDVDIDENWVEEDNDNHLAAAINGIINQLRQTHLNNVNVDVGEWSRRNRTDNRTRVDRLIRQQEAWSKLYSDLVDAYLHWDSTGAPLFDARTFQGKYHASIKVFDIFDCKSRRFPVAEETSVLITMAKYGYIGNAPIKPSWGFSLQILELFRVMNSRRPQLSIQRFMQGLCDLQRTAYLPSIRLNFSSAYDVYLEIISRISEKLQAEMGRDSDWHLKNACPACTFKTQGEPAMKYSMLIALDGNNSLRRMPKAVREHDEDGKLVVSEYIERLDTRSFNSDLYLSSEYVDQFKNEVKGSSKSASTTEVSEGSPTDGVDEPNPCVDRWTNLSDESSKKMWGVFHETGIFLAACRHGTALLLCDMIRSGELAKYPLSLVNRLIDVYGNDLLIGYDIGCGFSATASKSPKVGPKVSATQARFCVGSFHGHAHCRRCQLDWHPMYVAGAGIEDFETCERVFSESNSVAGPTRHASTFHRRQAILNHFIRWNKDKYAELSQFIMNNYRQSLQIIRENTSALADMLKALNLPSSDIFVQWLKDEKSYLNSLKKPIQSDHQSLGIDYVKTLKKLEAARVYFETTSNEWIHIPESTIQEPGFYQSQLAATQSLENTRLQSAHARGLDSVLMLQNAVQDFEIKLNIDESKRWTSECSEWAEAEKMIDQTDYQRVVDRLEGLVVSRLFELSKLNQSGIGVKMRTHIGKALKARAATIEKAIAEYNTIAPKLQRPILDIDTVLEYVSLGEFDLLRDSQHDLASFPWMRSAGRIATNLYFKLERAKEEIVRLNVEIKRLCLYMETEEKAWENLITRIQNTQPSLAFQATKHLRYLRSVNEVHDIRLARLVCLDGYSGPALSSDRYKRQEDVVEENEEENGEEDDLSDETLIDETEIIDTTLAFVSTLN